MRKYSIIRRAIEILQKEGIIVLLRKSRIYMKLELLLFPYAIYQLKKMKANKLDDSVDFCFNGMGGLIRPLQVRDEIIGLLKIVDQMKPKVMIEIGTHNGGTLFLFSRVVSEQAVIISIDFPDARFGGGYTVWRTPLYKAFKLTQQKLYLLRADSHKTETLNRVKDILKGREVDFVFIDGDHSYDGVKKDFEMYSSLVRKGGKMSFHDVLHHGEAGCEVGKFWNQLKQHGYKYNEIIADKNQGWGGIGVLEMNSEVEISGN